LFGKEIRMFSIRGCARSAWARKPGRALGAAVLAGALAGPALAQRAPLLQNLADVKKLPGVLVAQAQVKAPETALGITGYRIERVTLPETHSVTIQGRSTEVTEAWHVTVRFAVPLTVRDQAFSLVIDGRWCGFLQEAPDLLSAGTVCFDGTLIRSGAALGVTYRGVEIVSSPEDEKDLGPAAFFTDPGEAIHYASARLRLRRAR
jgi:hypothetical protein